jgi:D-inositol-3-phosphate glycosyltransferase
MDSSGALKVCIISPLGYTGLSYYDHSLCQALSEVGVRVTLVTSGKFVAQPKLISYEIKKFFVGNYGERTRFAKGIAYILGLAKSFFFILNRRFKIVHLQILEIPLADFLFASCLRLVGVKIVHTPHDIYSFKSSKEIFLRRKLYQSSNILFVHNVANKKQLMEDFGISSEQIRQVIHGNYEYFLDQSLTKRDARSRLNLTMDKKIVLLFGSLRQGKGIETAVKSFSMIKEKSQVLFLIVGKPARGFDMEALKKLIQETYLNGFLDLREGFVEDNLVEAYYKSADLVLVPYERVYESGVLRYAFSCGLPTVVSDIDEFSNFARDGENCILFKAGDSKDLAEKLEIALKENEDLTRIGLTAKKLSDDEWDWRKSAESTKKVYQTLV